MLTNKAYFAVAACAAAFSLTAAAAPSVSRLTPPSELFSSGQSDPVIARFLPGQRFDLQATIQPDDPSKSIAEASFAIDGKPVLATTSLRVCTSGCMKELPSNTVIATVRAVSIAAPGLHRFSVTAKQSDGQTGSANGNLEVVALEKGGQKIKNVIILLGDGIVDQYFDDRHLHGLAVLLGGGRKWFLPATTPGSARINSSDYAFSGTDPHTAEIVKRWGAAPGALDSNRDLIAEFEKAGYRYAATRSDLDRIDPRKTERLLGLFSLSNMNVALDKIAGRRGVKGGVSGGSVVEDYGFPDQPMLDEMSQKALDVLSRHKKGFVLMIEGASIDKQAHNMDTERWILDTIEFDRAVKVARQFADRNPGTLVVIAADHECAGAAIIGAARLTDDALRQAAEKAGGVVELRDKAVGTYEQAGFPRYTISSDGYPVTTDIDYRMLIGYGGNTDRYEDWRTNPLPLQDGQQPFVKRAPLLNYPAGPNDPDKGGAFLVIGQVPGGSAVHTASDIPLSAYGPGALAFSGVMDNTDVFFKIGQAMVAGAIDRLPRRLAPPARKSAK